MLASVTRPTDAHILRPTASLKNTRANTEVAAASNAVRIDALAAVVIVRPNIMNIGAAVSSKIIMAIHGPSRPDKPASLRFPFRRPCASSIADIPIAAPIYRNAAMNIGGMPARSILEQGEFRPKRSAAASAISAARLVSPIYLRSFTVAYPIHKNASRSLRREANCKSYLLRLRNGGTSRSSSSMTTLGLLTLPVSWLRSRPRSSYPPRVSRSRS